MSIVHCFPHGIKIPLFPILEKLLYVERDTSATKRSPDIISSKKCKNIMPTLTHLLVCHMFLVGSFKWRHVCSVIGETPPCRGAEPAIFILPNGIYLTWLRFPEQDTISQPKYCGGDCELESGDPRQELESVLREKSSAF